MNQTKESVLRSKLLEVFLSSEILSIKSPRNDDKHFDITIKSKKFAGLTLISQNRLVYKAISDLISNNIIHAVTLNLIIDESV